MMLAAVASAQYDAPVPPRGAYLVPGAASDGGGPLPRGRGLTQPGPGPVLRRIGTRGRGGLKPRPQQPPPLPPRPVIELEDEQAGPTTLPPPTYQPTTFQPPAFRPAIADLPVPTRQQFRGVPAEEAVYGRAPRPTQLPEEDSTFRGEEPQEEQAFTRARPTNSQEETGFTRARPTNSQEEQGGFQRKSEPQHFSRARPSLQEQSVFRPRPHVQDEQNIVRGRTEAIKPAFNRAQLQTRPPKVQNQQPPSGKTSSRQKKPTSQVISKYRDDNADGSITWGFENDDGTFKEETIGIDCVTRGKYGYIDPDGLRREYSYQSGIPCDRSQDSVVGASEGYIDYSKNKYIFPNGQEIPIDGMVKNRARRPVYKN